MAEIEHNVEQEVHMANYIMLRRINDVLMLMLNELNPEAANQIAELHEQGLFATPDPVIRGTHE